MILLGLNSKFPHMRQTTSIKKISHVKTCLILVSKLLAIYLFSYYRMLKIFNRLRIMGETGTFFTLHQFNFANKNFLFLQESLKCPYDREVFNIDVSKLEWDSYIRNCILGIRTYIFKDPIETLPAAQKKLQR